MRWTTRAELQLQVQRLWDKGRLLTCISGDVDLFPLRLTIRRPTSAEMSDRFDDVRAWIADLRSGKHYRIVMREVRHQVIGSNTIPDEIWIDSLDNALKLIGKNQEAERFKSVLDITNRRQPELIPWISKNPLRSLQLADDWPLLLDITVWMQAHPLPGIYLRQIELQNIHTKFIETHRGVLMELLDLVMTPSSINTETAGVKHFCRRYGFLDKPLRIRFRILDAELSLLATGTDQDIAVNQDAFNRLDMRVRRIFITENEINYLAFPMLPGSIVIFGAGYGFEALSQAEWLRRCPIHYWGDIDTHGFAILDQLRNHFPHVESFLMDRNTLLEHKQQWMKEPQPLRRVLTRLTSEENELYEDLRNNRIGSAVRLEQEKIGFSHVTATLNQFRFDQCGTI